MSVLLVDNRAGSKDLYAPLARMGLPAELCRLDYGDVAMTARDSDGFTIDIGVEHKTIQDAVASIRDGRLGGHQVPGMIGKQGLYAVGYLIIEGEWNVSESGHIAVKSKYSRKPKPLPGHMLYSEFAKKITTLELCAGLHVVYLPTRAHTLHWLANLYRWATDKPIDTHTSHLAPHNRPLGYLKISEFRDAVMKWPGVGLSVSKAAEDRFRTVQAASNGLVSDWADLVTVDRRGKPKRFGTANAVRVVEFLHGRKA